MLIAAMLLAGLAVFGYMAFADGGGRHTRAHLGTRQTDPPRFLGRW